VGFRRWLPLLVLAGVGLSGCTTGAGAVDQAAGGEFRFVAGTGTGETIAPADRRMGPEIRGDLLGGGQLDLTTLRGNVVVLNFWASWCGPCRVESPDFERAYQATKALGVRFVGVAIKNEEQDARAFVANWKITYPSLLDPNGKVTLRFRAFPPRALPYTIVFDRQGRVAAVYMTALLREDIEPVVRRLAAER
jgi:thiol-disulfide isomerase/thioredoxin